MHRRPLAPTRALSAAWARRFAVAAAILATASVIAAHHPRVSPEAALAGVAAALVGAGLAILCGLQAMRTIWRTGQPGLGRALFGMLLAAAILGYPAYLANAAARAPLTAAVATVADSSLRLSRSAKAARVRGIGAADRMDRPAVVADALTLEMSAADAYELVDDAVDALHWRKVDAVPPGGRLGLGHLDVTTFSPVMHLPQDIAIRVTPLGESSRVDILSVARLGRYDFGEGATTIRQFAEALAAQEDD